MGETIADGDVDNSGCTLWIGVVVSDVAEVNGAPNRPALPWVVNKLFGEIFNFSCLNSIRKRRLTRPNLDWAMVPTTSAYKSVTNWLSEARWVFWTREGELWLSKK